VPGGCNRGRATGVTAANHQHVELVHEGAIRSPQNCGSLA
jgi:hypothetical protein